MDDNHDPIHQFFPSTSADEFPSILYKTLNIPSSSSQQDIRSSYRRLALKYHPDKQSGKSEKDKADLSREFQKVGFAYAVLSDEARRKR